MYGEFFFGADVEVAAVALHLRYVGEVSGEDAPQYGLLFVG